MSQQPGLITDKHASFLELFFDLVFVFAVTQVAALLREEVDFLGLSKGLLLLMFLWWSWSLYTNSASRSVAACCSAVSA